MKALSRNIKKIWIILEVFEKLVKVRTQEVKNDGLNGKVLS
jgi:hypothetical protein